MNRRPEERVWFWLEGVCEIWIWYGIVGIWYLVLGLGLLMVN